jgi:hypothetical protein
MENLHSLEFGSNPVHTPGVASLFLLPIFEQTSISIPHKKGNKKRITTLLTRIKHMGISLTIPLFFEIALGFKFQMARKMGRSSLVNSFL